jgi:hypothetical protein
MTSEPTQTPFTSGITKYLPLIEKIFLTALIVGVILKISHIDSKVMGISLIGLGITYFLLAFKPSDIQLQENEQLTFTHLLALMIIPKTMLISAAISALGISLYLLNFGNQQGYKQLLLIGISTIGLGTILLTFFLLRDVKNLKTVTPVLLRAIPLLLASLYIFIK